MDPFDCYRHLRRTKRFVEKSWGHPIALNDVARAVGLSPAYYSTFFRKATGQPFCAWLRQQRIGRAKKILRECDRPVYQIATDVGFGSLSAFERAFKACECMTPTDYRRIEWNRGLADGTEENADNSKTEAERPGSLLI